jgi:hypothetical protein
MTPYERLIVALRHGVLVRRKAMQRFHSEVTHHSVRPADDDRFTVVPIEAANAIDAARRIAEIAARRRYEDGGAVGYVLPARGGDGRFYAAIGEQKRSHDGIALHGVTISIHVWPTG